MHIQQVLQFSEGLLFAALAVVMLVTVVKKWNEKLT